MQDVKNKLHNCKTKIAILKKHIKSLDKMVFRDKHSKSDLLGIYNAQINKINKRISYLTKQL